MLKNILQKLRSLYREKIQDTTKEWEETGKGKPEVLTSGLILAVKMPFKDRLKFLFTNSGCYRLTKYQHKMVKRL